MVLVQRALFEKRVASIVERGVVISVHKLSRRYSFEVPFEHLPKHPVVLDERAAGWLWATILFLGLGAVLSVAEIAQGTPQFEASAGYLILAGATAAVCMAKRQCFLVFHCHNERFHLLRNRPSRAAVDEFVDAIYAAKADFDEKRDSVLRPAPGPVAEILRLKRLFRLGYIDGEEYELLKQRIVFGPVNDDLEAESDEAEYN